MMRSSNKGFEFVRFLGFIVLFIIWPAKQPRPEKALWRDESNDSSFANRLKTGLLDFG